MVVRVKTKPTFEEEIILWSRGVQFIIGVDEVGRGAFAGPIVAAGVIFAQNINSDILCDVNDSKLLSPTARRQCAAIIKKTALIKK